MTHSMSEHASRNGLRIPVVKPIAFRGCVTEKCPVVEQSTPSGTWDAASCNMSLVSARTPNMLFHENTPSVLFYPTPVDSFPSGAAQYSTCPFQTDISDSMQLGPREFEDPLDSNLLSPCKSGYCRDVTAMAVTLAWSDVNDNDSLPAFPSIPESIKESQSLCLTSALGLQSPVASDSFADNATTMMLRGIPNKCTQEMVLEEIKRRNLLMDVDFFYLPFFPGARRNVGYCFVNFTSVAAAEKFHVAFHGEQLLKVKSEKMCQVSLGKVQGVANNVEMYRNAAVMSLDPQLQPVLLKDGKTLPFPEPTM